MSLKPDGYLLKSMNPQKLHAAIDDFFHHGENKPVTIPIAFCGGYIDIPQNAPCRRTFSLLKEPHHFL